MACAKYKHYETQQRKSGNPNHIIQTGSVSQEMFGGMTSVAFCSSQMESDPASAQRKQRKERVLLTYKAQHLPIHTRWQAGGQEMAARESAAITPIRTEPANTSLSSLNTSLS